MQWVHMWRNFSTQFTKQAITMDRKLDILVWSNPCIVLLFYFLSLGQGVLSKCYNIPFTLKNSIL